MELLREIVFRQFLCVIPVCAVFFMVGVSRSWLAPILNEANDPHSELPLSTEECSWLASMGGITQALSPLLFFFLVDRVGRRPVIILNAIISCCNCIIVYGSRNTFVHYFARLLCGLYTGMNYMIASIYICENCSPELRGTFSTIAVLFRYSGQSTVYAIAAFFSYKQTAIIYCVLAFTTLVSTLLLRETPQYLLMRGELTKAKINFARLRNMSDANAVNEFEAMKENIEQEREKTHLSLATMYRSKEVSRSIRVTVITTTLFMGSGWVMINSFMTKVFSTANDGGGGLPANDLSLYCSLFHLLSVGAASLFLERVNRRKLMITSGILTSIILAGIVLLYCIQIAHAFIGFQLLLFALFSISSSLQTGLLFPLVSLLCGELLPQSVKRMGTALSTSTGATVYFVNSLTFLFIAERFGMVMNFAINLACAVSMTAYAYYYVPETRGRTLVEIQNELKSVRKRESD